MNTLQILLIKFFIIVSLKLNVIVLSFNYCELEDFDRCVNHVACHNDNDHHHDGHRHSHSNVNKINHFDAESDVILVKFSLDDRDRMLDFINSNRNLIALGLTVLPQGSNITITVWDDELEFLSQKYLESMPHLETMDSCIYKENSKFTELRKGISMATTVRDGIKALFQFVGERILIHENLDNLRSESHITKIGCYFGKIVDLLDHNEHIRSEIICIIEYDADEIDRTELYKIGIPCSECGLNLGCDTFYQGLCLQTL